MSDQSKIVISEKMAQVLNDPNAMKILSDPHMMQCITEALQGILPNYKNRIEPLRKAFENQRREDQYKKSASKFTLAYNAFLNTDPSKYEIDRNE